MLPLYQLEPVPAFLFLALCIWCFGSVLPGLCVLLSSCGPTGCVLEARLEL